MSHEQPAESISAPPIAERAVQVQGMRLATAMNDAPRALLARAPLVVLPAIGPVWSDYRAILERFARERRVFALDWPGFGASDKPAPTTFAYSAASYADVLAGWMDALGIARAVFLGNGIGATAALLYAAAHPTRALGLALAAPLGFASPSLTGELLGKAAGNPTLLRLLEPTTYALALGPTTAATEAALAGYRARRASADATHTREATAALWRSLQSPTGDLPTLARNVATPSIILRGELDPLVTMADSRRAAEALGPRGALEVILPDAGHLPFLQQPTRFFKALDGLLAEANAAMLS